MKEQKSISVSAILGLINKPALMYWAVNCTIDHIREYLEGLLPKDKDVVLLDTSDKVVRDILAMLPEAKKASNRIGGESRKLGTQVHKAIEEIVISGTVPDLAIMSPEAMRCMEAFADFCRDNNILPFEDTLGCEVKVSGVLLSHISSTPIKIRGKYDWKVNIEGVPYIIDIKTSKALYPEAGIQVAAYQKMDNMGKGTEAPFSLKTERIGVLRLDKETGEYEFKDDYNMTAELLKFQALARAYAALNG